MKKAFLVLLTTLAALTVSVRANAQFGVIGGLTSSKAAVKDIHSVKGVNLYHAGITTKFDIGLGFAVQPSLIYQVKGANLSELGKENAMEDFQLKTGFIELPVQLQWGPDLLVFRPYLFGEPFIGYAITTDDKVLFSGESGAFKSWLNDSRNKLEYGIGLGIGLELFSHLQISAQYFSNFGKLFTPAVDGFPAVDTEDLRATVSEGVKNFQGIKVSLAVLF